MKAHFVGNGASQEIFLARQRYGYVAVGNYPKQIKFWDSTTIIDHKMVIWVSNHNKKLFKGRKIWCTPDVAKWATNFELLGKWHAILEPKIKFSSGHQAVQNLSKKFLFIDLWGMDSMYSDDLLSKMDEDIPRQKRPPLNNDWRPYWRDLFKRFPKVKYTIHAPQGVTKIDYGENCRYELH